MIKQQARHPLLVFLIVLLTILSLLGVSFRIVLLPQVTAILAENTVNSSLSALTHDELVEVAKKGRAYVAGDPEAQLPAGNNERVSFTPDVMQHMEDVRLVIRAAAYMTLAWLALLVVLLVIAGRRGGKRTVSSGLFIGGVSTVVLALILVAIGIISFDALFTTIHKLFFADGTWTFAEDSLLICAYPLPFWIGMGTVWGVSLVLLSALTSVIGLFLKKRTGRSSRR
ncbi:MAG: TIGR01906 family membrane protein [Coriobacteriia bacterium]|nr:TIGR01906 family membrane protein [Coriobacteriia bacterium]